MFRKLGICLFKGWSSTDVYTHELYQLHLPYITIFSFVSQDTETDLELPLQYTAPQYLTVIIMKTGNYTLLFYNFPPEDANHKFL